MERRVAIKIIKQNQQSYNQIADQFSASRYSIWPEFKFLVKYFKPNDRVLDLGCGNGRFYDLFQEEQLKVDYVGLDNSVELIKLAKQKYPQAHFELGDGLKLPFADNSFDKVLSIAVIHHIPSQAFRQQFLKEINRVLKKDGLLVLTSWYLWTLALLEKKRLKPFFKSTFLKLIGQSQLDFKDVYLSWGQDQKRYVHYFTKNEFKKLIQRNYFLIKKIGFIERKSGQKNLLAVAQKKELV